MAFLHWVSIQGVDESLREECSLERKQGAGDKFPLHLTHDLLVGIYLSKSLNFFLSQISLLLRREYFINSLEHPQDVVKDQLM